MLALGAVFIPCQCLPYEICSAYYIYHIWSPEKNLFHICPLHLAYFVFHFFQVISLGAVLLLSRQAVLGEEDLGRLPCTSGDPGLLTPGLGAGKEEDFTSWDQKTSEANSASSSSLTPCQAGAAPIISPLGFGSAAASPSVPQHPHH